MTNFGISFKKRMRMNCLLLALAVMLVAPASAQVSVYIGSATTVAAGSTQVVVSGDLTNDGTFAPQQSIVVFDGAGVQTVSNVDAFSSLSIDKTTGSLALGGTATTVENTLSLVNGELDNSSTNVALADDATIRRRNGALNAAPTFGATVNLVYEGDQQVSTGFEVPPADGPAKVNNFTVSNSEGVKLTAPVEVNGTLALEQGTLDNSEAEVTVSETGNVEPGAGEVSETPTYEGPVMIVYDGTTARATGTELPDTTDVLVIDNPAGISLSKNVVVGDTLSVQGALVLNGQTVTLAAPDAILIESSEAQITGATGAIQATRSLNAPEDRNVAGLGLRITSSQDLGATTIMRSHGQAFDGEDIAIARTYDVAPENNTALDASLVFPYRESELGEVIEEPLRLYRLSEGGAWVDVGGEVDTTANTVSLAGLSSLARFAAGAPRTKVSNEDTPLLPEAFALHSAFPNPFSSRATIRYELPEAAEVSLQVYDVLGRRVMTLADERKPAGVHETFFSANGLSSGVYFYRIRAGDFTATRRMMLVR